MTISTKLFSKHGNLDIAVDYTGELDEDFNKLDALALIGKELYKRFGGDVSSEINLILGIMHSGAMEKDRDYFASENFEYHCALLGLDADEILEQIVRKNLLAKCNNKITGLKKYKDVIKFQFNIEGYSYRELSIKYGVSTRTIGRLINDKKDLTSDM